MQCACLDAPCSATPPAPQAAHQLHPTRPAPPLPTARQEAQQGVVDAMGHGAVRDACSGRSAAQAWHKVAGVNGQQ